MPEGNSQSLFLTTDSKVQPLLSFLRSPGNLLVGSLRHDEWMLSGLQLIVASPSEVVHGRALRIKTVILDSHVECPKQMRFFPDSVVRHPMRLPAGSTVEPNELRLPDLFTPGMEDARFWTGAMSFAAGSDVVQADNSCVLAFVINAVRCLVETPDSQVLVLAPHDRVGLVSEFITSLIDHLSLQALSASTDLKTKARTLVVASPEKLVLDGVNPSSKVEKVIIIEADRLLQFKEQLASVFSQLPGHVRFGVHSETIHPEVLDMMSNLGRRFVDLPKRRLSLDGVRHFFIKVEENEKLEMLAKIWEEVSVTLHRIAVFCNTPESVETLAEEMGNRGVEVCATHSNLTGEEMTQRIGVTGWNMLITNVDSQFICEVINFELPQTAQEYVPRVWQDCSNRVAINFVATEADEMVIEQVRNEFGAEVQPMPEEGVYYALFKDLGPPAYSTYL